MKQCIDDNNCDDVFTLFFCKVVVNNNLHQKYNSINCISFIGEPIPVTR